MWAQLRHPPGGADARALLNAQLVDKTGTGVWNACSVLYLTVVCGLGARRVGLLLGVAGVAGVIGSPAAGWLAGRFPARTLLIGCHLLRLVTMFLVLVFASFGALIAVVAATFLGDRAAKMLEMLLATQAAGEQRSLYQALSRSVSNVGYGLGAGIAAIGLAIGTRDAFRVLIAVDGLSFLLAAVLVRQVRTGRRVSAPAGDVAAAPAVAPWRDPGYLRFVLLDVVMTSDDSVLKVGLPLWLLTRTSAPRALVPWFLIINTGLVVALQMGISRAVDRPGRVTAAVTWYGLVMFGAAGLLALAPVCGAWQASAVLLAAAGLVTLAELMRSVSSWELSVALAPESARASYLGVAGMSQSVQKCAGPMALTSLVMPAGPVGWLAFGSAIAGLSVLQRRGTRRALRNGAA